MSQGDVNLHSNRAMARLITVFYGIDEKSISNNELYAESLKRINNLAQYRRLRIFAGKNEVPPVIWLVLLVGGTSTVSYAFFFGMKNIQPQSMITPALTVTVTLILFLIYILDLPFTVTGTGSTEPLKHALAIVKNERG